MLKYYTNTNHSLICFKTESFHRKARWIRAEPESTLGLCPRVTDYKYIRKITITI